MKIQKRKKKGSKVQLTYRIPESLAKAFREKCDKEGVYQTDVIEALISRWTGRN